MGNLKEQWLKSVDFVLALILFGVATSALFVFVSAVRLYVSNAKKTANKSLGARPERRSIGPSGREGDRRKHEGNVEFPLQLDDRIIERDRRRIPDRRQGTMH